MKLRKALGAVVGAVGATAAANRVLQSQAGAFEPMLEGEQGTYRWRGFDIAYTEAGDPSDPDLVLFHGINAAASSHEFHTVFDTLAEEYHVIAPDLPGFGHTDRPPLLYSASLYTAFVRDFIEDNTTDATVVASSLTGAYAASAAQEVEVKELVLICPTDTSMGNRTVWLRSLLRAPVVGEAIYNLTVSKPPSATSTLTTGTTIWTTSPTQWSTTSGRAATSPVRGSRRRRSSPASSTRRTTSAKYWQASTCP